MATTTSTMLAAEFSPDSAVLKLKQVPKPTPANDEVLLRVRACGVCHSDIVLLDRRETYDGPFVAGHEICGEAVSVGQDVGDAVELGALYSVDLGQTQPPGTDWRHALHGTAGLGRDGGYAQYTALPARALVRVPPGVSAAQAAVAADAGTTAHRAVFGVAKVRAGERVLVIGAGGLGVLAVQLARIAGAATVLAVDPRPHARALAKERGADAVFAPDELDAAIAGGLGLDVVLDFVAVPATFAQGSKALQSLALQSICDARLVLVGVGHGTVTLDLRAIVVGQVRILGSLYGMREDLEGVLKLIQQGKLQMDVEESPLKQVNEVLDDLREGKIRSRMVVVPPE